MDQAFYQAICHYAAGDLEAAAAAARSIATQSELYAQAARWLEQAVQGGLTGVYLDADAFGAFIRGGGNLAMYATLEKMVAAAWDTYRPRSILDIGTGDGQILAGALGRTGLRPLPAFTLVEPATHLLSQALTGLVRHSPPLEVCTFQGSIQAYVQAAPPTARWDLCQATWSLQNLSSAERRPLLRWLSQRCAKLLIAEFDVQAEKYPLLSPERVRLIHNHYIIGLAEYTGRMDPALEERVKQGFLMPVLFGYFRAGAGRSTHEQTLETWDAEIQAAGFRSLRHELIIRYWWADAYLLTAYA